MVWICFLTLAVGFKNAGQINLSQFDIYSSNLELFITGDHVIAILLDSSDKGMLLIDAKGKLIAKCGRQGQGPREFQSPDAVWWDASGQHFSVFDSENARISNWSREGKFKSSTPFPHKIKTPKPSSGSKLFYLKNERGLFPDAPAIMTLDLKDGKPRKLWEVSGRLVLPTVDVHGSVMVVSTDWDPRLRLGLGSDFIATVFTDSNEVHILDWEGNPRKKFPVTFKQYEVSDREIDRQIEKSFSIARPILKAKRRELYENKIWPAIRSVFVDRRDRIWVVGQKDRKPLGKFPVLIYDSAGGKLEQAELAHEPVFLAGGSVFSLVETGDAVLLDRVDVIQE